VLINLQKKQRLLFPHFQHRSHMTQPKPVSVHVPGIPGNCVISVNILQGFDAVGLAVQFNVKA
jgi:hypothetical protein